MKMNKIEACNNLIQLYSFYFKKMGLQADYREAVTLAIAALMNKSE